MMLLLLVLACAEPSGDGHTGDGSASDGGTDGGADGGGTAEVLRPTFSNPAEADDLDDAAGIVHVRLVAAAVVHEFGAEQGFDEALTVEGYAYNGQVPGPTIRATLGDTLVVDLDNDLDDDTTIHWHGVEVPWEMDGITWMQDPIEPGGSFSYSFELDRAGTFWYHPHFDTAHQVDLGLYGVVVVEDPADPPADVELVAVFDQWGEQEEVPGSTSDETDAHGLDYDSRPWTVNGLHEPSLDLDAGSVVRMRTVNASNQGYIDMAGDGLRQIGSDQGLLPSIAEPESLLLAPGDRADLEFLPGEADISVSTHPYSLRGGSTLGDDEVLLRLPLATPGSAASSLAWPFPGGVPSDDPGHTDVTWVFTGSDEGGGWMMNGEVYPDVTVEQLALGAEAVIEVRNISPTEHPFHLHGARFEVLSVDGEPPAAQTIEDTVNVGIHQRVRLLLTPENAGDWMAHCHILPHAEEGMMTVLRVEDSTADR